MNQFLKPILDITEDLKFYSNELQSLLKQIAMYAFALIVGISLISYITDYLDLNSTVYHLLLIITIAAHIQTRTYLFAEINSDWKVKREQLGKLKLRRESLFTKMNALTNQADLLRSSIYDNTTNRDALTLKAYQYKLDITQLQIEITQLDSNIVNNTISKSFSEIPVIIQSALNKAKEVRALRKEIIKLIVSQETSNNKLESERKLLSTTERQIAYYQSQLAKFN